MTTTDDSAVDIGPRREDTRLRLAWTVIGLLAAVAVLIVIFIWVHGANDAAQLLITGVFMPIVSVAGTVLGFYFGSREPQVTP